MVEQMVCERNKAHCSPIRRRFLKIIVAALLLNTAEAQTERAPWLERTKTSDLIARRDARAQQKRTEEQQAQRSRKTLPMGSSVTPITIRPRKYQLGATGKPTVSWIHWAEF